MEHHWISLYQNRPLKSYTWYIVNYKQANENKAIIILGSSWFDKKVRVTVTQENGKFYAEPQRRIYDATGDPPSSTFEFRKWNGLVYMGNHDPPCDSHGEDPCDCTEEATIVDLKAWPINNYEEFQYFMTTFFGTKLSPAPLQHTIL